MQPYLRAIYRLPKGGFEIDAQLVRGPEEYPIQVGRVEGLVSFPQLARGSFGWPRLIAPQLIKLGSDADRSSGRGRASEWGWPDLDRFDEAGSVEVRMVGMRFTLPTNEGDVARQVAAELFEAVGPWSRTLSAWLAVLSDQRRAIEPDSVTLPGVEPPDELHGLELLYVDQAGNSTRQHPSPQPMTFSVVSTNKLSRDAWLAILAYASRGTAPPTERLLLHGALLGLERGDLRRSVLDSGTAAEVALTRMLDERLRLAPPEIAEVVRRQARGLDRLSATLRRLGVEPPPRLQQGLVDVRNQAAHAGSQPKWKEARDAFVLARRVVDQAQPLDRALR